MTSEGGNIKVFMRVRPSKRPSGFFSPAADNQTLEFSVPDAHVDALGHARGSNVKFRFDGIFDMGAKQDDVFDQVAKDAVDSALDGYNATIFAYGQTGSGKTFTITGGAERYQDRGIIPRALSRVFQAFKDRPQVQYSAYISYLELYNEVGYDLLDPSHETKTLEELPRVSLMEDEEGCVHLRNLSMHPASNEEEALNLLFLGDTNRAIAETPMNLASSRSHCIFTISVESRQEGSSTIRRSKLHLVDLAGSERTHKTNSSGQLFREATHINKSLHFLEMVIVALQEQKKGVRSHVPYRNSMLTNVIRDSLGGNCKTSMIATINPEPEHTDESISTCRFAQRVACVRNSAFVNEETDPTLLIRQLKSKLSNMENELKFAKGEMGDGEELSQAEKDEIFAMAKAWVNGPETAEFAIGQLTLNRIHAAFSALHRVANDIRANAKPMLTDSKVADEAEKAAAGKSDDAPPSPSKDEVKKLKAQLQQRDNEIAILVNMVKSAKATAAAQVALTTGSAGGNSNAATMMTLPAAALSTGGSNNTSSVPPLHLSAPASAGSQRLPTPTATSAASVGIMLANGSNVSEEVLKDRDKAFEVFRSTYPKNDVIEENKRILREKYDAAKVTAERVNRAREETNRLKSDIERRRVEKAMANIVDGGPDAETRSADADVMEAGLKAEMDAQKNEYKVAFQTLRDLKTEIEHIQRLLESNRSKMQSDFESWYANCLSRVSASSSNLPTRSSAEMATLPSTSSTSRPQSEGMSVGASSRSSAPAGPTPMPPGGMYGFPPMGGYPHQPPMMPMPPYMPPSPYGMSGQPPGYGMSGQPPGYGVPGQPPAYSMGPPQSSGMPYNMPPRPTPSSSTTPAMPGVPLTGNAEADADILAFYKAKEELLKRTKSGGSAGFAGVLAEAAKASATLTKPS